MFNEKKRDKVARAREENTLIQGYFEFKTNGCFVEVGANDPTNFGSQSYHLEKDLNWQGVLIEPVPELAEKCRATRPNSKVFESACIDSNFTEKIKLYIPKSSINGEELHSKSSIGKNIDDGNFSEYREIFVKARTLDSILEEAKINKIDLLSIDVEGAELGVLKGLNIGYYAPKLILLEDKHLYLVKHRYLKKQGYKLVRRTRQNCWYIPVDAERPIQTYFEKIRLLKRMYLSIWIKKLVFSIRHKTLKPFARL